MIKKILLSPLFVLFIYCSNSFADCSDFDGANIIASDGKYLGKVASQYQSESIFNEYGTYGSVYSSNSIWNKYGTYGSEYSSKSPFNKYSSSPPEIVKNEKTIGFLTVSQFKQGAINPIELGTVCYDITRTR